MTYRIKASSCQDSLGCSLYTSPIPMQIPHDIAAIQLGEHLRYLIDLRSGETETIIPGRGRLAAVCARPWGREEVSIDEVPEDGDESEARN